MSLHIDLAPTLALLLFVSGPISVSTHLASAVHRDTAPLIAARQAACVSLRVNPTTCSRVACVSEFACVSRGLVRRALIPERVPGTSMMLPGGSAESR